MDTNKMRDICREEFETSPKFRGMDFTRAPEAPDYYLSPYANGAWDGWRASREAVVVELPQVVAYEAGYDSLRDNEYAGLPDQLPDFEYDEIYPLHRSDEVRAAIEAQGLKVAP